VAGPDPLGKRALYWMPVEAEAEVDEQPVTVGAGAVGADSPAVDLGRRHARPAGKHALFSTPTPAEDGDPATSTGTEVDPLPPTGLFTVVCSSCGAVSRVGLFDLVLLHLPWGAWLPRRAFDRWMRCPACRCRTWLSVTVSR
jgi:hypothetical protein